MQLRPSWILCALLVSGPALACTPEEATAKAEELAKKVAQVTEQNPERAARLHEKVEDKGGETHAKDMQTDCEAYDQRMRELDQYDR